MTGARHRPRLPRSRYPTRRGHHRRRAGVHRPRVPPRLHPAGHPLAQAATPLAEPQRLRRTLPRQRADLHYRTAFRYRFYETVTDLEDDLRAWLRYYNFERPHRGYRTRGRIPAGTFYASRPDLLTAKGWNPDDIKPAA